MSRATRRPLRLLQATAFVSTMDRFAMAPMLTVMSVDLGIPLASVVTAAGAYFLAYGLMQPVWGVVSDWLGLVRTLRLTLVLAGIASVASAAADGAASLVATRAVAGAFFAAAYPACLIYLGDTVPVRERQPQIAKLMVGIALGTAAASLGAAALAEVSSWRLVLALTGLAALVASLSLRPLPKPTDERRDTGIIRPFRRVAASGMTLAVLVLAFVEGGAVLGSLTLLPAAVESTGVSASLAGAAAGVYGLSVYVTSGLVGRLAGRTHPAALIAIGCAAATAACAALSVDQSVVTGMLAAALLGVAWTSMHSSLQTWATEVLPEQRATVVSLFAGALFCGSAVAAMLVSDLADARRWGATFGVAALACAALGTAASVLRVKWGVGVRDFERRQSDTATSSALPSQQPAPSPGSPPPAT